MLFITTFIKKFEFGVRGCRQNEGGSNEGWFAHHLLYGVRPIRYETGRTIQRGRDPLMEGGEFVVYFPL
jgi:hypothetical protein